MDQNIPICGRDGCNNLVTHKMKHGKPTSHFNEYCSKNCRDIASGWKSGVMKKEMYYDTDNFDARDYVENL